MNYGLTIYGPFGDTSSEKEDAARRIMVVFPSTSVGQIQTVWATMRDYHFFNTIDIVAKHDDALLVHVYGAPVDVPEDADCLFHAKISHEGRYE